MHASKNDDRIIGEGEREEWFDGRDLARRWKISVRTVQRMAARGLIPTAVRFGQLRRWSRRAIEAWESAQ